MADQKRDNSSVVIGLAIAAALVAFGLWSVMSKKAERQSAQQRGLTEQDVQRIIRREKADEDYLEYLRKNPNSGRRGSRPAH